VTATAVEVAPPEPVVAGPDEVLTIPWSATAEDRAYRLARSCQVPLADLLASWLAAGDTDAPVPAERSGAVNVLLPGEVLAQVRAEALRRSLTVGEVCAARLASVAGRG